MLLIQSVANRFGSAALAGYTAASKIDFFAIMPYLACSNALSTYTAQNIGAGRGDRIELGNKACLKLCAAISVTELAVILLLRNVFLGLFLDSDTASTEAWETGSLYMTTMSICYILMGINSTQSGMLRGLGMLKTLFANSIISLAVRVIFANVMVSYIGISCVWLSMPAGWIVSIIFCRIVYCREKSRQQ